MNEYGEENPCCYFHPQEVVTGVCALCLKERLLILASKQGHLPLHKDTKVLHRKSILSLPKIFALGSFLHGLDFRHSKPDDSDDDDASTSQDDSFISIKFEENGAASWNKDTNSKVSLEPVDMSNNHNLKKESKGVKSVVEHVKSQGGVRWRKRIGQLFHLIKWKRSSKGNVCHVGNKVGGVKVRKGWIRTLTKRRTM